MSGARREAERDKGRGRLTSDFAEVNACGLTSTMGNFDKGSTSPFESCRAYSCSRGLSAGAGCQLPLLLRQKHEKPTHAPTNGHSTSGFTPSGTSVKCTNCCRRGSHTR